jgi:hypothetical protein
MFQLHYTEEIVFTLSWILGQDDAVKSPECPCSEKTEAVNRFRFKGSGAKKGRKTPKFFEIYLNWTYYRAILAKGEWISLMPLLLFMI